MAHLGQHNPSTMELNTMTTQTKPKSTPYFTLIERETAQGPWCICFGDYSRKVVQQELDDLRYSARINHPRGKGPSWRIIRTGDTQGKINAAVDALNAELAAINPTPANAPVIAPERDAYLQKNPKQATVNDILASWRGLK